MKNLVIAIFLALALAFPHAAAAKAPASYPNAFYVRDAGMVENCVMDVSEGNVEYRLIDDGVFSAICFTVGQTLQGRIVNNQTVEISYTDAKGRKKIARYQIVSQWVLKVPGS